MTFPRWRSPWVILDCAGRRRPRGGSTSLSTAGGSRFLRFGGYTIPIQARVTIFHGQPFVAWYEGSKSSHNREKSSRAVAPIFGQCSSLDIFQSSDRFKQELAQRLHSKFRSSPENWRGLYIAGLFRPVIDPDSSQTVRNDNS